jgi:hypothetical protein
MLWDVFISHANDDKEAVARPLAALLESKGLRVWLDEQQLKVGDSLSGKIGDGLAFSQFGIVILSPAFFANDYPQKELQALLSRQTSQGRYILPVLHELEHSELKTRAPLIADLLAISTSRGLESVANELKRSAFGGTAPRDSAGGPRYFREFSFPKHLLTEALGAISSLELPKTWQHLEPKRDMLDSSTWMGTDAEVMVTLFFYLYAPIVHLHRLRYSLERTVSTLTAPERLRFGLLDAALRALGEDAALAASEPALPYTPRCSNWRQQRAAIPQKFWWQGLTRERFESAAALFYNSDNVTAQPDLRHFKRIYHVAYEASGPAQQTVGLLANALYGFTPKTRPVYWRLLMLWRCLYSFLDSVSADQPRDALMDGIMSARPILQSDQLTSVQSSELPESKVSTNAALLQYYGEFIRPRLRTHVVSAQAEV